MKDTWFSMRGTARDKRRFLRWARLRADRCGVFLGRFRRVHDWDAAGGPQWIAKPVRGGGHGFVTVSYD